VVLARRSHKRLITLYGHFAGARRKESPKSLRGNPYKSGIMVLKKIYKYDDTVTQFAHGLTAKC
jgi:hypothetical protein